MQGRHNETYFMRSDELYTVWRLLLAGESLISRFNVIKG